MTVWTDEHDEAMKACLADNMSFSEIAAALNARFRLRLTRNACIGRAGRKGWKSLVRRGARKRARIEREKIIVFKAPKPKPPPTMRAQLLQLRCVSVEPVHKDILELDHDDCRYPYGDGPFTFCGHPARSDSSYCAPHMALALNPDQRFHAAREAAE